MVERQRKQLLRSRLLGWFVQLPAVLLMAFFLIGVSRFTSGPLQEGRIKKGHYDELTVGLLELKPTPFLKADGVDGAGIFIKDDDDTAILQLLSGREGGSITVNDENGDLRAILAGGERLGGHLALYDDDRQSKVTLSTINSKGLIRVNGSKEYLLAEISEDSSGMPQFRILNDDDNVVTMGGHSNDHGSVGVFDAEGTLRIMLTAAETKGTTPAVSIFNKDGSAIAVLGQLEDGRAILSLDDPEGKAERLNFIPERN